MCRPEWEAGSEWAVTRIKDHKFIGPERKFLVEWAGVDKDGQPWDDWWLDERDVGSFHVNVYMRRLLSVESKVVSVDLKPVVYTVRKSVAHAVALAKTKARPRVHFLEINVLDIEALGMAFLELVQFPGKLNVSQKKSERKVPIKKTKEDGGITMYSVVYENMEDIAAFTQFEHFLAHDTATGALRYKLGRASNEDLMCVGMPLEFSFSQNKSIEGMGSFMVSFPTVHINGKFGTVQPPAFGKNSKAPLKEKKNRDLLADYIMATIPDSHSLVTKGWRELPRGCTSLPAHVAVPSN